MAFGQNGNDDDIFDDGYFGRERPRGVGRSWEGVLLGRCNVRLAVRGIYTCSFLGFSSILFF